MIDNLFSIFVIGFIVTLVIGVVVLSLESIITKFPKIQNWIDNMFIDNVEEE